MSSITVQQLRDSQGVPLIDVREPDEFAVVRVPGAVNIPMSQFGERLDELPDGAIHLVCKSGIRSARVAEALNARGYAVANVEGGTDAWIEAGLPVES